MKVLGSIFISLCTVSISVAQLPSLPTLPSLSTSTTSSSSGTSSKATTSSLPTLSSLTAPSSTISSSTSTVASPTITKTSTTSVSSPTSTSSTSTTSSFNKSSSQGAITLDVKNVHQVDLDTLNIDAGGNWLEKRIWYEKAEQLFDAIRDLVSKVVDFRVHFSNEVNAAGQKIDSFYESVSYDKGQIDEMLKDLLADLDQQQAERGDLSVEERTLQQNVKKEQAVLDQIGKDIKTIGDIDAKIDETLMTAFKVIDKSRSFEEKSWNNFKAIGKTLDDKKARNMYYEMDNYQKNIEQLLKYLQSTLFTYLQKTLVAKVDSNISKIKSSMSSLKSKGVDLDKLMQKYQTQDLKVEKERQEEATKIAVDKALSKAEEEAEARRAKQRAAAKAAYQKTFEYKAKQFFCQAGCMMKNAYCFIIGKLQTAGCYMRGMFKNAYCQIQSWFSAKN